MQSNAVNKVLEMVTARRLHCGGLWIFCPQCLQDSEFPWSQNGFQVVQSCCCVSRILGCQNLLAQRTACQEIAMLLL